jgi:hypothetical protein
LPDEYDLDFENIKTELFLAAKVWEDISVVYECVRASWEQIAIEFRLVRSGSYNFENISTIFQIISGSIIKNIPVIFSIIHQPQTFASYIIQKLFCVTTAFTGSVEELSDWNVRPNKTWFVSVENGHVTLYDMQTDMEGEINPIAEGEADEDSLQVFLSYIDEYEGDVDFYYQDIPFHLSLSNLYSNGTFQIKPLTDLSEIRHPIYNNSNIVLSRGEAELNLHTNVVKKRELILGVHLPEIESGDSIRLTSARRDIVQENSQILEQTISGSVSDDGTASLINTINVANYMELFR